MLEAIVVGAGQAGLAASYHLAAHGIEHVVLERGRVGETWRSERWDSFALNTPGWYSRLPGDSSGLEPADGFAHRETFVAYLAGYAERHGVPVRTGVTVTSVVPAGSGAFAVRTDAAESMTASNVIFAAGSQRVARIPGAAGSLPSSINQLHSVAYRNPAQLPRGAVLVVGSGQSGGQITEDLLDDGRTVYLATSRVGRMRRRYRGRDCVEWLVEMGFYGHTVGQLTDPALQFAPQPSISGIGRHGHTLSLQWLAARGAILLGHVEDIRDGRLVLRDDVAANVRFGDERAADFRGWVDAWIAEHGIEAEPAEQDDADRAYPDPDALHSPETLELEAAGIGSVIWTTGVMGDYGWLPPAAVGPNGQPLHHEGASPLPGLYFLGLPWQRVRASGIIGGADADAALLAAAIAERLGQRPKRH